MNVKHIFVFTICFVIPNGLYMSKSDDKSEKDRLSKRQAVVDHFTDKDRSKSPIYKDNQDNVYLRVFVVPRSNRTAIFAPENKEIGIYLMSAPVKGESNLEMLDYLVKILDINRNRIALLHPKSKFYNFQYNYQVSVQHQIYKCAGVAHFIVFDISEVGSRTRRKMIKLFGKCITMEEVIRKLVDECIKHQNQ